jgi:hypothetical protein
MPDFESFVARHGEFGVQALLERMERYEGKRAEIGASLEDRWEAFADSRPVEINVAG